MKFMLWTRLSRNAHFYSSRLIRAAVVSDFLTVLCSKTTEIYTHVYEYFYSKIKSIRFVNIVVK